MVALLAVKVKVRIARGQNWLSYFNILLYLGGIANYRYLIEYPLAAYGLGIGYLIGCYALGYYDEIYGIWKLESVYGSRNLNPFMEALDKKIDRILEK